MERTNHNSRCDFQGCNTSKKRAWVAKVMTFQSAWRTLQDIKTLNMIRKCRV
jgi:hypothetical protein